MSESLGGDVGSDVLRWLERSREVGFLGPKPVAPHVEHALGFVEVVGDPPTSVVDLGSGGGVPGLVMAAVWPETTFVLLDSMERRTDFLREAVADLGWQERVQVVRARAEVTGRDDAYRGWFDVVVSRGFGSPPVTAECGAPLLRLDGRLVVSEPPTEVVDRWPADGVALLGLAYDGRTTTSSGAGYAVLRQSRPCSVKFPRKEGVPAKRPLW
jgi:hypothetical protein